jgi:hypothetical protein
VREGLSCWTEVQHAPHQGFALRILCAVAHGGQIRRGGILIPRARKFENLMCNSIRGEGGIIPLDWCPTRSTSRLRRKDFALSRMVVKPSYRVLIPPYRELFPNRKLEIWCAIRMAVREGLSCWTGVQHAPHQGFAVRILRCRAWWSNPPNRVLIPPYRELFPNRKLEIWCAIRMAVREGFEPSEPFWSSEL